MEFRDDALSDLNFPMDCRSIRKRNFFKEDADPDTRHLFSSALKIWICFREIIFSGLECFRSPLLELFTKLIFIYFIYKMMVECCRVKAIKTLCADPDQRIMENFGAFAPITFNECLNCTIFEPVGWVCGIQQSSHSNLR